MLIGVDQNNLPSFALPVVANDVREMQTVLADPACCGYPPGHIKVLNGQQASHQGILDGLAWLQRSIAADESGNATAIVYFSCHGGHGGNGQYYLMPFDSDRCSLGAAEFCSEIARLAPARLLVALDCCHAAGMAVKDAGEDKVSSQSVWLKGWASAALAPGLILGGGKGAVGPADGAKGLESLSHGSGRAVLSSSTGEQKSYLRIDGRMSVFTYHLIEALTGHAPTPEDAREVLVSDIMGHVSRTVPTTVRSERAQEQIPDFLIAGGNFPIALLLGGERKNQSQRQSKRQSKSQSASSSAKKRITDQKDSKYATKITGRVKNLHIGDTIINTAGGTHIAGSVNIKIGDFVGRDKIIHSPKGTSEDEESERTKKKGKP